MPFFLYCHKPLNIISLWHKQKKNTWDPPKPILHTFRVHKLNLSRHCEPLKEPSKDKQALNHQEKCPEWVSKAAGQRLMCGSMHVCKDMRHKKQHIAFHTAKEKEENPTRDSSCCCKTGSPCPRPRSTREWVSRRNLQAEMLENTEAPDLAQDTQHQLLWQHGFLNSVPWLEKTQHQQLILFTLDKAGFPHSSP